MSVDLDNPGEHHEWARVLESVMKERDREAHRAKYHSEMSERLGLDVARMRDERDQARAESDRYLEHGRALHREIEKVAHTLNEIGWPSENVSATERACRALRMLAADRDAYRKAKQENDERFMIERDEARAEVKRLRETLDREFSIGAEYQRLWATACAERDVWSGKACEEEQQAGNGPCGACRYCLPGMLIEALSELDLLRPVAEAAKRWRRCDETPLQPKPGEVFTLKDCNHDDLADAVDALISAEAKESP